MTGPETMATTSEVHREVLNVVITACGLGPAADALLTDVATLRWMSETDQPELLTILAHRGRELNRQAHYLNAERVIPQHEALSNGLAEIAQWRSARTNTSNDAAERDAETARRILGAIAAAGAAYGRIRFPDG